MLTRTTIVGFFLLAAAETRGQATAAGAQAVPAPIAPVALGEVFVRVQPRLLTLRAPGEAKGLHDVVSNSLGPGEQVAVWHPNPDSAHLYRIQAVRVRLGSRFPESLAGFVSHRRNFREGRLALRLSAATATGQPAVANLLAAPLLLAPAQSEELDHGWVRFDVSEQRVVLPAKGLFVVAEGLTASPADTFIRRRTLVHPADAKKPPEDYKPAFRNGKGTSTRTYMYEEIQTAGEQGSRLVPSSYFPAVAHRTVAAPAECRSWQVLRGPMSGWKSLGAFYAEIRQRNPGLDLTDYNYDLELEVVEL